MTTNDKEIVAAAMYWFGSGLITAGASVACGVSGGLIASGAMAVLFVILNTR